MSKQAWERTIRVSVTSNTWNQVAVPAPSRGIIQRFVIAQVDGGVAGFQAELLNRRDATQAETTSLSLGFDTNEAYSRPAHRVLPAITVAGGTALSEQHQLQAGYENKDEQDARRVPSHTLWLDIRPNGSGTKQFDVTIVVEPFNG